MTVGLIYYQHSSNSSSSHCYCGWLAKQVQRPIASIYTFMFYGRSTSFLLCVLFFFRPFQPSDLLDGIKGLSLPVFLFVPVDSGGSSSTCGEGGGRERKKPHGMVLGQQTHSAHPCKF